MYLRNPKTNFCVELSWGNVASIAVWDPGCILQRDVLNIYRMATCFDKS